MNPYETPGQSSEKTPGPPSLENVAHDGIRLSGRPCPSCGSKNTSGDTLSRTSPNIIFVIFFGWIFLLIRTALSKKTDRCRDCGEVNTYKSTGSKVAIVSLIVLAILIALSAMEPAGSTY